MKASFPSSCRNVVVAEIPSHFLRVVALNVPGGWLAVFLCVRCALATACPSVCALHRSEAESVPALTALSSCLSLLCFRWPHSGSGRCYFIDMLFLIFFFLFFKHHCSLSLSNMRVELRCINESASKSRLCPRFSFLFSPFLKQVHSNAASCVFAADIQPRSSSGLCFSRLV